MSEDWITIWTLHRNGQTKRAEFCQVDGFGLELRYTHDGQHYAWLRFRRGWDLMNEAWTERTDLEASGWRLSAPVARNGPPIERLRLHHTFKNQTRNH
jgi:hypothetical protein